MNKNSKQTSSRAATVAGKTLGSSTSSTIQKSLAGSTLFALASDLGRRLPPT